MPTRPTANDLLVHALDGRDGTIRWTWRSGGSEGNYWARGVIELIDLDGKGKDSICVTYGDRQSGTAIVLLDPHGKERARRVIPPERVPSDFPPPWPTSWSTSTATAATSCWCGTTTEGAPGAAT